MAATFRTPNRRPGGPGDNINLGSPSLIPRAQQGTPTGTATSEVGTSMSGTSDSRKRQSKKDEVVPLQSYLSYVQGNSSKTRK